MGRRRRSEEATKLRIEKRKAWKNEAKRGVSQEYTQCEKKNEMFEKYYKEQEFIKEEDWEDFMNTLREPLPTTFRVTGFKGQSEELLKLLHSEYFSKLLSKSSDDQEIETPFQLPWYPNGLAWQLNLGRKEIRHSEVLKGLKDFLISETDTGNISRQEAVSMIPPLALDVKPHHRVLDMCAAPGSKTAQLIEMLQDENTSSEMDSGFVVANDADNKRCYLMCHQVKRLESTKFAVINHDAQFLPGMKYTTSAGQQKLRFDRVLADVPCTGDGTMRKNIDAWGKWNPAAAHALNAVQRRILKRGLELLEVGGRLVYSTCSLNPVEDEAVLAGVLVDEGLQDCVQLVDVSAQLPGLKYVPGSKTWKVMSRSGEFFSAYSDVPERLQTQIRPHIFPPSEENAEKLHLERCIRILPHLQNTGGFFVAVLEKIKDKNAPTVQLASMQDAKLEDGAEPVDQMNIKQTTEVEPNQNKKRPHNPDDPLPLKKQRLKGYKEDPFVFLTGEEDFWVSVKEFYNWENFPVQLLMARSNEGNKRNLYFVSKAVKDIVLTNQEHVRFINLGMKILNRSVTKYSKVDYRFVQSGIEVLSNYCENRTVKVTGADLLQLLQNENPFKSKFTKDVQHQAEQLEQGSLIFQYDPDTDAESTCDYPPITLRVCGWLGVVTMRTFLSKHEREHLLRLFHQKVAPPEKSVSLKDETGGQEDQCATDGVKEAVSDVEQEDDQCDTDEMKEALTSTNQDAKDKEVSCSNGDQVTDEMNA